MSINFITHCLDKKSIGGVTRVTIDLANTLCEEKNVEVNLISLGTIDEPAYTISPKVNIEELGLKEHDPTFYKGASKLVWFYDSYRVLNQYLKEKPSQDEILIFTSPPLCILASILKFKFNNYVFIGHEHTSTHYSKGRIVDSIKFVLYKKLDVLIALTNEDRKKYIELGLRSTLLPNYFDKGIIKLSHNNNRKYVLYVGRFSPEKQPLLALEIYAKSKLYNNGVFFRMFGTGELEKDIINYIFDNNIQDYVEVYNNITDHDEIYKDAYALILTSRIEGFGMVLVEAISRNIPCIAFDVPSGPKSIIQNGNNGYLIQPEEVDVFIKKLISQEILELHNIDISYTVDKYNKDLILDKWLHLFKRSSRE